VVESSVETKTEHLDIAKSLLPLTQEGSCDNTLSLMQQMTEVNNSMASRDLKNHL